MLCDKGDETLGVGGGGCNLLVYLLTEYGLPQVLLLLLLSVYTCGVFQQSSVPWAGLEECVCVRGVFVALHYTANCIVVV